MATIIIHAGHFKPGKIAIQIRGRRERLDAVRFTGFMSQPKGNRYVDP
jgi:hypothetical protein